MGGGQSRLDCAVVVMITLSKLTLLFLLSCSTALGQNGYLASSLIPYNKLVAGLKASSPSETKTYTFDVDRNTLYLCHPDLLCAPANAGVCPYGNNVRYKETYCETGYRSVPKTWGFGNFQLSHSCSITLYGCQTKPGAPKKSLNQVIEDLSKSSVSKFHTNWDDCSNEEKYCGTRLYEAAKAFGGCEMSMKNGVCTITFLIFEKWPEFSNHLTDEQIFQKAQNTGVVLKVKTPRQCSQRKSFFINKCKSGGSSYSRAASYENYPEYFCHLRIQCHRWMPWSPFSQSRPISAKFSALGKSGPRTAGQKPVAKKEPKPMKIEKKMVAILDEAPKTKIVKSESIDIPISDTLSE